MIKLSVIRSNRNRMTESFILFRQALHGFLLGELIQQQRFGDDVVLQRRQADGLVRAMRVGLRILRTGDQHLRLRKMRCNSGMNGMEPPSPLLTGATPNASSMASMASLVASAFGSMAQPMPLSSLSTHTSAPNGACSTMNLANASWASSRALVRRGAQAQTERGFRRDDVEGSFHRMRVEPDDGDAGLRPQTRGERTGAGKTIRFDDARVGAHSRLVHITLQAANRFLGRNARHGQIAIGVVHGGNQHRSQRVRVKNRAAILAGMHRMFQRLDMHINIGVATQRRGQRRNLQRTSCPNRPQ